MMGPKSNFSCCMFDARPGLKQCYYRLLEVDSLAWLLGVAPRVVSVVALTQHNKAGLWDVVRTFFSDVTRVVQRGNVDSSHNAGRNVPQWPPVVVPNILMYYLLCPESSP